MHTRLIFSSITSIIWKRIRLQKDTRHWDNIVTFLNNVMSLIIKRV